MVLIRGVPVDRLGPDRASAVYWGMGAHLGRPWPQNHKGHLLGDVTDQGKSGYDPTSRGNEIGGVAFPFHSDGSDLVGLFCLDAGASGGASLVANAVSIHNELVRTAPDLAAELYEPFAYDMRGEEKPGTQALVPDAGVHAEGPPAVHPLHPALHPLGPPSPRRAGAVGGRQRGDGPGRRHVRRSRRSTCRCSCAPATCSS